MMLQRDHLLADERDVHASGTSRLCMASKGGKMRGPPRKISMMGITKESMRKFPSAYEVVCTKVSCRSSGAFRHVSTGIGACCAMDTRLFLPSLSSCRPTDDAVSRLMCQLHSSLLAFLAGCAWPGTYLVPMFALWYAHVCQLDSRRQRFVE